MRAIAVLVCLGCGGGSQKGSAPPPAVPAPVAEPEPPPPEDEPPEERALVMKTQGLPPRCAEYKVRMLRCVESDKFPAASRDAVKQAFAQLEQNWAVNGAAPEVLAATDEACGQAIASMRQAGDQMCPGVWSAPLSRRAPGRVYGRVADCTELVDKMDLCIEVGGFPDEARAAARQTLDEMIRGWDQVRDDEASLRAAGDACRMAIDAVRAQTIDMCPGIW